jgi:DnaJ like chaperone protein
LPLVCRQGQALALWGITGDMASWNGKVIGGVLGALFGGPMGAAMGALAGHQYDAHVDARGGTGSGARVQQLFFPATFRLMGHIAKSDGRVSEQEVAAARSLMQALHLNDAQIAQAIEHYNAGKQAGFTLSGALGALHDAIAGHSQLVQFFIELQLQVAIVGNGLEGRPRQRLRAAAEYLGMPPAHFARLETMMRWRAGAGRGDYSGNGTSSYSAAAEAERLVQAYALLEIERAASDEQVVKAYRRQMSRHHPDKLQANGLPESMLERAKERTQQIQAAYELLKSVRGIG